jgi:hypothetical protein
VSDFFDRLEAELADLARRGAHLPGTAGQDPHALAVLIRRCIVVLAVAVVLAAAFVSEFPASAGGDPLVAQVMVAPGL